MGLQQTPTTRRTLALCVAAATTGGAHAICLSDVQVGALAVHCAAKTPADPPEAVSAAEGSKTRAKLNAASASSSASAVNVGTRTGVLGTTIPVLVTRRDRYAMLDGWRDRQVMPTDANNVLPGGGNRSEVPEHPVNAVVWLTGAVQKENITLPPGDLVSLESFFPLRLPEAGLQGDALYQGLPGAPPVRLRFQ